MLMSKTTEVRDLAMLEEHPIAKVFPMMTAGEIKKLAEDIKKNGLRNPITLFDGKILDGRNRAKAALQAGVKITQFDNLPDGTDPISYVVSMNLNRRHMTEAQRALAAADLAKLKWGVNRYKGLKNVEGSEDTSTLKIDDAARLFNISAPSIKRGRRLKRDGVPELIDAVNKGEIGLAQAAQEISKLPPEKQKEAVAMAKKDKKPSKPKPKNTPKDEPKPKIKPIIRVRWSEVDPAAMAKELIEQLDGIEAMRFVNALTAAFNKELDAWEAEEVKAGRATRLSFGPGKTRKNT